MVFSMSVTVGRVCRRHPGLHTAEVRTAGVCLTACAYVVLWAHEPGAGALQDCVFSIELDSAAAAAVRTLRLAPCVTAVPQQQTGRNTQWCR
jgi:hypothetical protein